MDHLAVFPATQYVTSKPTIERAVVEIRHELEERLKELEAEGKQLEAHRLRQRTEYDVEMMSELGFCSGIENYSRILDGRPAGSAPYTLIDYFPSDFVCFIDESHQTVPQLGGMYEGDRSRKQTLSTSASGCRRRSTTGRCASTSSSSACPSSSSSPRRPGRSSSATRRSSPSS